MIKQRGVTLVEVLVVVGVLGVILVTLTMILFNSFQVNNKVGYISEVEESGTTATAEIRRRLLAADPANLNCTGGSINFTDKFNPTDSITISCTEGGKIQLISSVSGTVVLVSQNVSASECANFVTCTDPNSAAREVEVVFRLSAGSQTDPGDKSFASQQFKTRVTIRN